MKSINDLRENHRGRFEENIKLKIVIMRCYTEIKRLSQESGLYPDIQLLEDIDELRLEPK